MKNLLILLAGWTRSKKNILGVTICISIFTAGFYAQGNLSLYFNLSGIAIVLGGTFGASIISFRLKRLIIAVKVLIGSYRYEIKKIDEIIFLLVDLSVKSKIKGLLSLQEDEDEITVLFLRRALGFLVDGYPLDQIRDLLTTEMYFFRLRREETERVFRIMAEIAPSFGLVGSVVGLIGMLVGVGDTTVILATIPIALTSTLYGVVLSNFFFLPFAANIKERTAQELFLQKIITEGVIAIGSNLHPRVLENKLKSFLTPASRNVSLVSFERIQEKFKLKKVQKVKPVKSVKKKTEDDLKEEV